MTDPGLALEQARATKRRAGEKPKLTAQRSTTPAGGGVTRLQRGQAPLKLDPDTYYTPLQWSELSGYTLASLSTLRSRRERFPYVKLGGAIFYKGSALLEALERNAVRVGPQKSART